MALGYLIPLGLYVGMVRPLERMPNGGLGAGAMLAALFVLGLATIVGFPLIGVAIALMAWRAEGGSRSTTLIVALGAIAAVLPVALLYTHAKL